MRGRVLQIKQTARFVLAAKDDVAPMDLVLFYDRISINLMIVEKEQVSPLGRHRLLPPLDEAGSWLDLENASVHDEKQFPLSPRCDVISDLI